MSTRYNYFVVVLNNYNKVKCYSQMKDKEAAKKIIKISKKDPNFYSKADVIYAKMIKNRIKKQKQCLKGEKNE